MNHRGWYRALVIGGLASVFILGMLLSWWSDPHVPARVGTAAYGHNGPGSLALGLGLVAVEASLAGLATLPWRRDGYWITTGGLALVLVPWTVVWFVLSMHQGGIVLAHLVWLLTLVATLASFTAYGAGRALFSLLSKPAAEVPRTTTS